MAHTSCALIRFRHTVTEWELTAPSHVDWALSVGGQVVSRVGGHLCYHRDGNFLPALAFLTRQRQHLREHSAGMICKSQCTSYDVGGCNCKVPMAEGRTDSLKRGCMTQVQPRLQHSSEVAPAKLGHKSQ